MLDDTAELHGRRRRGPLAEFGITLNDVIRRWSESSDRK